MGTPRHDHRLFVLLLAGLFISLQHLPLTAREAPDKHSLTNTFVWLETDETNGLFKVPYGREQPVAAIYDFFHIKGLDSITNQTFQFAPFRSHFFLSNRQPFMTNLLPAEVEPLLFQPLSINEASVELLKTLPGVGKLTAQKIVDYRKRAGPIKGMKDLEKINGIGRISAEKIGSYVRY